MIAWFPHRDSTTIAGTDYRWFIQRCGLLTLPEIYPQQVVLSGQDGWAFNVAIRFHAIARNLVDAQPSFYWSPYYLVSLIIDQTRKDLTLLEAVEAIAVARLLDVAAVTQLQQLGVWPTASEEDKRRWA